MNRTLSVALLCGALMWGPAAIAQDIGDADQGQRVFNKCKSCHQVGDGARDKVGPILNDLFGRTAGTWEGYANKFSKAMVAAGENGLVWNAETLTEYLRKPRAYVDGTKMAFAGFRKDEDIANLLAYLLTFSPDYDPEAESTEDGAGDDNTADE